MPASGKHTSLKREAALFFGLLFIGFVVVPGIIFLIGQKIFGDFGGQGYADFFGTLSGKIRRGELVAWFFVLAPYFTLQTIRLTLFGWRQCGRPPGIGRPGGQSPNL